MKKQKGLGRGLEALLDGAGDFAEKAPAVVGAPTSLPVTQMQAGKYNRVRAWTKVRWPS